MPLPRDWAKSSYSDPNGGDCVQARHPAAGMVQVRDSKDPNGTILTVSAHRWLGFPFPNDPPHVSRLALNAPSPCRNGADVPGTTRVPHPSHPARCRLDGDPGQEPEPLGTGWYVLRAFGPPCGRIHQPRLDMTPSTEEPFDLLP